MADYDRAGWVSSFVVEAMTSALDHWSRPGTDMPDPDVFDACVKVLGAMDVEYECRFDSRHHWAGDTPADVDYGRACGCEQARELISALEGIVGDSVDEMTRFTSRARARRFLTTMAREADDDQE